MSALDFLCVCVCALARSPHIDTERTRTTAADRMIPIPAANHHVSSAMTSKGPLVLP